MRMHRRSAGYYRVDDGVFVETAPWAPAPSLRPRRKDDARGPEVNWMSGLFRTTVRATSVIKWVPAWSLAVLAARPAGAGEPCYYTWVPIPNPPGWIAAGGAINNLGHVAGALVNTGDYYRAFVWTPETGTVVLPLPPGAVG